MRVLSFVLASASAFAFSSSALSAEGAVNPFKVGLNLQSNSFEEVVDCVIVSYHEFLLFDNLAKGRVEVPKELTPAYIIKERERRLFFLRSWGGKLAFSGESTLGETDDYESSILHNLRSDGAATKDFLDANNDKLRVCDKFVTDAAKKVSKQ